MITKDFEPHPSESLIAKFKKFISKEPAAAAAFKKFESDEDLASRLTSRKSLLEDRKNTNSDKYAVISSKIDGLSSPELLDGLVQGLIGAVESQYDSYLDLHIRANFVNSNRKTILDKLKSKLIDAPERELSEFLKENEKDLERLGIS